MSASGRRTWARGVFALAACLVLLVGIGWGTGVIAKLWNTPAAVTALDEIERAPDAASAAVDFDGGQATAHWSQSVGKVVLVAEGLPQLPTDRTFELWFVRGDEPVPAGTFDADGGAATAELTGTMQPGDTIAVTVEPAGGSPSGAPTTAPIIAIPTV
ncbi:anti-sigma factor [Microbacterium aurum]|uniref:anti-sigma factor n=1 Tax=Microbacterium aurum TaxID=36805 RepID=UPI003D2F0585